MDKEKKYSLYRHTSPSGKVYIGITSQPVEHRWNHGRGYLNIKKAPFKSTIIKYGWDNIKHEILFNNLSEDRAKRLEVELIRHYRGLGISLNFTDGGDGCHGRIPWNKGIKVPYEQSNKRKGVHLTEEHKQKLSEAHKGKHHKGHKWTDAQRAKFISQRIGSHRSEETKKKISENSAFSRTVIEFDEVGNVIRKFCSAADAGRFYGIDGGYISASCNNRTLCCGHRFMHEDDIVDISQIKYGRFIDGNSVTIRSKETGEIKEFNSEKSCARFLGIKNSVSVRKAIKKGYTLKKEWEVIEYKGAKVEHIPSIAKNKPKALICTNIDTKEQQLLPSILACKRFLGLGSDTSIKKALLGIRKSNIINGWEVRYAA